MTSEIQLPATTESRAIEPTGGADSRSDQRSRPRQDLTVALLPLALAVLVIAVFGMALWTLAATTPGL